MTSQWPQCEWSVGLRIDYHRGINQEGAVVILQWAWVREIFTDALMMYPYLWRHPPPRHNPRLGPLVRAGGQETLSVSGSRSEPAFRETFSKAVTLFGNQLQRVASSSNTTIPNLRQGANCAGGNFNHAKNAAQLQKETPPHRHATTKRSRRTFTATTSNLPGYCSHLWRLNTPPTQRGSNGSRSYSGRICCT